MNYAEKQKLILNGKMLSVIWKLSLPLMVSNLIQTLFNLTDTYFVSQLGGSGVAALSITWNLIFVMMAVGIGFSIAGTSIISQLIGAGDHKDAQKVAGQALSLSVLFALVMAVGGYLLAPNLVRLVGATGDLHTNAVTYIRIMFLGGPMMFAYFAFQSIKQAQGDTLTPTIIGGLAVGLNIILDPIFILHLDWGVAGAAYATVLARSVFTIYAVGTLFLKDNGIRLRLSDLKLDKEIVTKIVRISLPSSTGMATSAVGFTIMNALILDYGQAVLTAFALGSRISSLVMMPAMGIGGALATIVGQNMGADQNDRAKSAFWTSMGVSASIMLASGLLVYPFIEVIAGLFTKEPEVINHAILNMRIIVLTLPLMAVFEVLNGLFQGSGHTKSAMIIQMGRLWALRLPMIFLLKNFTTFGPLGVWYAMVASNFITCVVGLLIYSTGKWQTKVVKTQDKVALSS